MERLIQLWGLPKTFKRFPGCQPISIERRHFPILKANQYVICDKTDGERFLLLIHRVNGENQCCLIDRGRFDYYKYSSSKGMLRWNCP